MGMYTEIVYAAELQREAPQQVIDVLAYMVGDSETQPSLLPDHPLFRTARWDIMLRCDSYYFDGDTHSTFRFDDIAGAWVLTVRSNFKNYDGEIDLFVDWLAPHIATAPGTLLGYQRYEESEQPSLIFAGEA